MDDQPKHFSRAEILERYWGEFFEIQKQERAKRLKSGWGIAKGLFDEALFWDWYVENVEGRDASE